MILSLLSLISFIPLILSQNPSCSSGNSIPTFSNCVRVHFINILRLKDALTDPNGQVGPTDITSACASLASDQTQYYTCLCDKAKGVLGCYSSFCPSDPSMNTASQYQVQFCGAVNNIAVISNATITTTVSRVDTTSAMSTSTGSSSTAVSSTVPSKNDASSVSFGAFGIFLAFVL